MVRGIIEKSHRGPGKVVFSENVNDLLNKVTKMMDGEEKDIKA